MLSSTVGQTVSQCVVAVQDSLVFSWSSAVVSKLWGVFRLIILLRGQSWNCKTQRNPAALNKLNISPTGLCRQPGQTGRPQFTCYVVNVECFCFSTVKHSLRHVHTGSSEIPNVPDTVAVVFVDGYQTNHYDSITKRMVPKQPWMSRVSEDDPDYWERETLFWRYQEQRARLHIEFYKERFNQSGGTFTECSLLTAERGFSSCSKH